MGLWDIPGTLYSPLIDSMASPSPLPADFQASYNNRESYPRNLLQKSISSYPIALASYAKRLDEHASYLCQIDIDRVEVCFRDLKANDGAGKDIAKRNIHSPKVLTEWLGIRHLGAGPQSQLLGVVEKDPKCRFVYIHGQNTRARLNITRSMLSEILTFHQVMPDILDYLFIFGLQSEPRDLGFSSFREQVSLKPSFSKSSISSLGRSGRQYQICYNLKGVTEKSVDLETPAHNEYSIRPAAFYHRFDVVGGNALWIVTKGGMDVQDRFKELTGRDARPEDKSFGDAQECFRSSLSAHLMFCHWSTEDWRGYIRWLEHVIDMETKMAVLAPTSNGTYFTLYAAADIQRFLGWQEKISEAIAVLESNIEVMKSLMRFYTRLQDRKDFDLQSSCTDDIEEFCNQLCSLVDDFTLQISRARALVKLTGDRGELIKQHRLERLNQNMEREAIMVRIVTIVTLIYLPATFVSTFFSTDIIKYQGQDSPKGNFSPIAMERWLQVTLPLTSITLLIAYYGNKWAEKRAGRRMLSPSHLGQSNTVSRLGVDPSTPAARTPQIPSRIHKAWRPKIWGTNSIPLAPVKSTSFTPSQIV